MIKQRNNTFKSKRKCKKINKLIESHFNDNTCETIDGDNDDDNDSENLQEESRGGVIDENKNEDIYETRNSTKLKKITAAKRKKNKLYQRIFVTNIKNKKKDRRKSSKYP